jgi:DNA-binding transcriptional ArsR family regulator
MVRRPARVQRSLVFAASNRATERSPLAKEPYAIIFNLMVEHQLDAVFDALAHPARRDILDRLARGGEATVTEIAAPYDVSLNAVSKHLKVLERAGLIERGRDAQWRPCRLRAEPLREVDDWVEQYRRHWEESMDRLDEYLQTLKAEREEDGYTND